MTTPSSSFAACWRSSSATRSSIATAAATPRPRSPRMNSSPASKGLQDNAETTISSRLVPVAGLRPQIVARRLAGQRRRALDDARPVRRPGQGYGPGLLRLSHHRGFVERALPLPALARRLPELYRQPAQARSRRAGAVSRARAEAPGDRAAAVGGGASP